MFRIILFVFCLCLSTCSNNSRDLFFSFSKKIPIKKQASSENLFRDKKAVIPHSLLAKIDSCKSIDELFKIQKIIRLELTKGTEINRVVSCVVLDDCIFVNDPSRNLYVLKFDRDGKFIKRIGEIGQGPGEYEHGAGLIFRYTQDQIIVNDQLGMKILFYDKEGKYIKSIPFSIQGLNIGLGSVISGDNKDILYGIDCSTNDLTIPRHLVFDLKEIKVLYGFERRLDPTLKYMATTKGFDFINGSLWIGGDWDDAIRIYNRDGIKIGHLQGVMPNSLQIEDWPKEMEFPMPTNQLDKPQRIFHIGDLVMVIGKLNELDLYYRLYNSNGKLLRKAIKPGERGIPVDFINGNNMVQTLKYDSNDTYSTSLLNKLREAGLEDETGEHENNPFLIFCELDY